MKVLLPLISLLLPAVASAPLAARAQVTAAPPGAGAPAAALGPNALLEAAPPAGVAAVPAASADEPRTLARAINLPAQQKMPESFGAPHQLVIGGSTSLNVHGFHAQQRGQKVDTFSLDFSPWVGGFVARHLLLGATLPVSYARGAGSWYANVGVGPFLGLHVPVSTHLGLLPRLGVAYVFGRQHTNATVARPGDTHAVFLNGRLDAVVHLTHHFSVAFGPYAEWSVVNRYAKTKQPWLTYYGLQVSMLGWL